MSTVKHAINTSKLTGDMAIIFEEIKSLGLYVNIDLLQYVTVLDFPNLPLSVEIRLGDNRYAHIEFDAETKIKTMRLIEGVTEIIMPFKSKELVYASFGCILATLSQYAVYQSLFKETWDTTKTEKISPDIVNLMGLFQQEEKKPQQKIQVVSSRVH